MGADEEGTHERVKAHAGLCVTPRRHDWLADGNRVTKVISVASLSKCHGAPGLRIGWAITRDAELRRQLVVGKFNTIVSGPTR